MKLLCITAFLLIGSVCCQNNISYDLKNIKKIMSKIPGLKHFLLFEEFQEAIRNKCQVNGRNDVFEKFVVVKDDLQQYIRNNFNYTKIQEEVEVSKKIGSMDEVFSKYCDKTPLVVAFVKNVSDTVEPCLEEEEKLSMQLILKISESLASFVCHKDGDLIALFIAEEGFECLNSKRDGLQQCLNGTLVHKIPEDLSLTNLSLFSVNKEKLCGDYLTLQKCFEQVLDTCNEVTPSNIIQAMFKYVRKEISCNELQHNISDGKDRISLNNTKDESGKKDESNPLLSLYDQFGEKYESTCLNNGGEKAAEEFREAFMQVKICYKSVEQNFRVNVKTMAKSPFLQLCKDLNTTLRECLVNLSNKTEACLSPAEAYVPKLGIDLYDSMFDFYCNSSRRPIEKFLLGRDVHISTTIIACVNQTTYIKKYAKEDVITKSELCEDINFVKNCLVEVSTQRYSDEYSEKQFLVKFADALYAPCSVDAENIIE